MAEPIDKMEVESKLKNFTYYFIRKIEEKLAFYLDIIEEFLTTHPTSKIGSALSAAASLIPYIGKGASGTIKEGDSLVLQRLDKKNALAVAEIVYHRRDNKGEVRKMFIKAAYELFCCFEMQFLEVTCDGGPTRAMQKLGYDAGQRFLNYITDNQSKSITEKLILESIVFDNSNVLNKLGIVNQGRTIKDSENHSWDTSGIYTKVGVYIKETDSCYIKKVSDIVSYGYRLKFSFESYEDIKKNWEKTTVPYAYRFCTNFADFEEVYQSLDEYVCKQNPDDFAKYDRSMKFVEIIKVLENHNKEILVDSANRYLDAAEHRKMLQSSSMEKTDKNHQEVKTILTHISNAQKAIEGELQKATNPAPRSLTSEEATVALVNKTVEDKIDDVSIGQLIEKELCKIKPALSDIKEGISNVVQRSRPPVEQAVALANDNITPVLSSIKDTFANGIEDLRRSPPPLPSMEETAALINDNVTPVLTHVKDTLSGAIEDIGRSLPVEETAARVNEIVNNNVAPVFINIKDTFSNLFG